MHEVARNEENLTERKRGSTYKRGREDWGRVRKLPSGKVQAGYTTPQGQFVLSPKTFTTLTDAREWLTMTRSDIMRGVSSNTSYEDSQAKKAGDRVTLGQYAQQWRARNSITGLRPLKPRTVMEYERYMKSTMHELAEMRLGAITAADVERWYLETATRAPNQAAKAYSHLKTVMSDAVIRKARTSNPCLVDRRNRQLETAEAQVPTKNQVSKMMDAAPEHLKALIELAAWGGFRKGELLELRRKDLTLMEAEGKAVTGKSGVPLYEVTVQRTVMTHSGAKTVGTPKTKASKRVVSMPERSSSIIERHFELMPDGPEVLLFPGPKTIGGAWDKHFGDSSFHQTFDRIRKAADYGGSFHSLRSFALTIYGETGATLAQIMRRGGHTRVETAMRYQRDLGTDLDRVTLLG
jgi:integrase